MPAFANTETFVWNIFGYDQQFERYRSVTLYVRHPVYKNYIMYKIQSTLMPTVLPLFHGAMGLLCLT